MKFSLDSFLAFIVKFFSMLFVILAPIVPVAGAANSSGGDAAANTGSGGGAPVGVVDLVVVPGETLTYVIGSGGTGSSGTNGAGNGGNVGSGGLIIEFYLI